MKRPDGSWAQIDTTLKNTAGTIRPVATTVPVRFSRGATDRLVTVGEGADVWTLRWPAALPAPRLDGEKAASTACMPTPTRARRRAGTSPTCRSRGYGWVDPSVTVPGVTVNDWVRWYTCATAPAAWWSERAKVEADIIRRDVAAVLGREPIDAYETAEVLITRNAEIVALDAPDDTVSTPDGADSPAPDTSEFTPPPILCGLVENALLQPGWRIEHPAIRGVLIGPHGERIDAARSITRTETGFDLRPLRTVLRPGISHAPSRQSR